MLLNILMRRRTDPEQERSQEFLREYTELSDRLQTIRTNYDHVSEDAEIDALIYEENAVLTRLSALYRRAREIGLHVEFPC